MDVTHRFWAATALAGVLAVEALLVEQPVFLVGAVGIAAWLLGRQYLFVRGVKRTVDAIEVIQTVDRVRVPTTSPVVVALRARLPFETPLVVGVEANLPLTATTAQPEATTRTIPVGEQTMATEFVIEFPIAGTYRVAPPTITISEEAGLFTTTVALGPRPTLTVTPFVRTRPIEPPINYGEDFARKWGPGVELGGIREYQPGDAVHRIEWNASARLKQLFVREVESETDRMTVIIFDHRAAMDQGPRGRTKLDYARQGALSIVSNARAVGEPLGLYAVGEDGITVQYQPTIGRKSYDRATAYLYDRLDDERPTAQRRTQRVRATTGDRKRIRQQLQADTTAFGVTLRPFYADRGGPTNAHIDPLYRTVRANLRNCVNCNTVVFTDDSSRAEVLNAVKLARTGQNRVFVFLTPTVLFEPDALADVERAYERYLQFEAFRITLSRIDGVTAIEVAPTDSVDSLLTRLRATTHTRPR